MYNVLHDYCFNSGVSPKHLLIIAGGYLSP